MENLELYNKLSPVPVEAKRAIEAGRLKGKTDINPMWRIKTLTEQFGPCGIGWKYEIVRFWLEDGAQSEKAAFCQINLYFKNGEQWSEPIPGIGGSGFIETERSGLHTSDECFKMALTDAISVACKALGVAGSVYWDKDPTKYTVAPEQAPEPPKCSKCGKPIVKGVSFKGEKLTPQQLHDKYGVCPDCLRSEIEAAKAAQK